MDLPARVAAFVRAEGLSAPGVIAVSGGPDSVALARLLRECFPSGRLVLAHVNHQLRGPESDADEAFVASLPAHWASPPLLAPSPVVGEGEKNAAMEVRAVRLTTAADAARERGNLEAVARRQRYDWLGHLARDVGAAWVAVGHTADDQAETVLFRLLRGSGLPGLAGMPARRPLAPGVDLVRPLLAVRRADVRQYLADRRQPARDDASNRDRRFTRNRLRHELLPLLQREYNPAVVDVLGRLARQAGEAAADLSARAAQLLAAAELPRAGAVVVLRADGLCRAAAPVARELFRLVWQREGWPMGEMNFDDWDRLRAVAAGAVAGWDFPGRVRARRAGAVVQVFAPAGRRQK